MAVTELIFPSIKTDPESLNEIERDWPTISKRLIDPNPGLLNAFRGFILTENGVDVRDAYREILLFEWVKTEDFHAFVKSEQFATFAGSIRHLVTGPPTLQLFETDASPREAASASIVETFRLSVSSPEHVATSMEAWDRFVQIIKAKHTPITYGTSTNLENDVVVGIIGWSSEETRSRIVQDPEYAEALRSLQRLGTLNQIVVDIDAMNLAPPSGI
ncbi:uncharacterized protein KD926_008403 [Aspergillus affinis]|uniref:uncharacterized protein n=1 Tax=Aspergillus affinis TaxID=1070780 RepID=UPI0022FDEEC9|nr:uncharacterized protein KD926_008403 [Aspergillus affinis]KAI9040313.1 hypothetical protein KD926_008403 [Aspergillus affinis]